MSYAMKGIQVEKSISNSFITSTVAQEFLRVRNTETGDARYFTPATHKFSPLAIEAYLAGRKLFLDRPSDRPLFKGLTDTLIMDFNNEFPSVLEYGHIGIADLLNTGMQGIFSESVNHLPKRERKDLVRKFRFLVDQGVKCIPVGQAHIPLAFDLIKRLIGRGSNLKADFRNSLNDMLILGAAIANNADLWTKDKPLAQFIEEEGLSQVKSRRDHYEITFNATENEPSRASRESKGYINTGWRYAIHRAPTIDAPAERR
ncbi:hypothetical protein [Streptomyces noursei]|uniref:hypothetical protein n=1 Tax=Streptomyces noursei TaxID=1971 RepID=UPI0023B8089D|nr:hypothetical protein [Streptomyces noursei]